VLGFDAQRQSVPARRHIGYLAGDAQFYRDMTGAQLFDYVDSLRGGVDRSYLERLIEAMELDASRPIGTLSRGNRQKVGIIQALMARPELVIMDEPTTGLDPIMQDAVEDLLREVRADGRTVFFSSHVLAEVEQLCTRAAVLRAGEVVRVIDLAEQRRIAPREVRVRFAEAPSAAAFDGLVGIRLLAADGPVMRFETNGSVDGLVKRLAQHTVIELESTEPTLEDLFRSLYVEREAAAADDAAAEVDR
jgi:ABC-2 type transport system ATP-binding protein